MAIKVPIIILLLFVFGLQAKADILYLKNGRAIQGIIVREKEEYVSLDIGSGVLKFYKDQIQSIERCSSGNNELIRQQWDKEKAAYESRVKEIQETKAHEPNYTSVGSQNGQLVVEALLNKKVKARFVLDTGASLIVLSGDLASRLGIGVSGDPKNFLPLVLADGRRVMAQRTILDSVSVQGSEVNRVEAAVLFSQDNRVFSGADGLLGMTFLEKFSFKIDRKNNKLILEKL
jgi:clan AA aspartic protease (TIGR02281 family)